MSALPGSYLGYGSGAEIPPGSPRIEVQPDPRMMEQKARKDFDVYFKKREVE